MRFEVVLDAVLVVAEIRTELEVLENGEALEEATVLGNHRDAPLHPVRRRLVVDDLAVEDDIAGRRSDHAEERLERRRLARGVAAEQTDELARIDGEVHVLEDVDRAVVGVDVPELRGIGSRSSRRRS